MEQRIQKLISASGLMSRRAAEEAIAAGRVTVNGYVAATGEKADPAYDELLIDGKPLPAPDKHIYLMLNKPMGYFTTLSDEKGRKTVAELTASVGTRLYPVGRLDASSEGLLIMTNDGDFANALMHPSGGFKKTYRVKVRVAEQPDQVPEKQDGSLQFAEEEPDTERQDTDRQNTVRRNMVHQNTVRRNTVRRSSEKEGASSARPNRKAEELIPALKDSIDIDGKMTVPAEIRIVKADGKNAVVDVTISEGRNRQVRRLCEHAGLQVLRLTRIQEGPLHLGYLHSGAYRNLTEQELAQLRKLM